MKAGLFPAANTANGRYYAVPIQLTNYREETFRVDHQIGSKLNLMGSLLYDNGSQSQSPPLWAGGTYATAGSIMSVPSWAGVVHATYTISPTLLNEAAFNYNGNNLNINDVGLYQKPSGYTVPNFFTANKDNKLPGISIGSPYNVSYTPGWWPWNNTWRSWQGKDDLSWTHGKHNMKFGGSYMYTHKWQQFQLNSGGQFNFNSSATGNGFADFMLGFASSYSEPASVDFVHISNKTLQPLRHGRLAGQQPVDAQSGYPLGRHSPCLRLRTARRRTSIRTSTTRSKRRPSCRAALWTRTVPDSPPSPALLCRT